MGQQAGTRMTALYRQRRHRALRNDATVPAAELRPDVTGHYKASGDIIKHFPDILAQRPHRLAAMRTIRFRAMGHLFAWQVVREGFVFGMLFCVAWLDGFCRGPGSNLSLVCFQLINQKAQLIQAFTGGPERAPPQHRQLVFQLLDQ